MELNRLQIQAIKDKAGYKNTDYCNVSAADVREFLLEQEIKLGNKKKKETLLQMIWEDESLTQSFCEKFYDQFYCNIYDLVNSYHLSWEEAQGLIESGLVEATGELNKKGYPLLTLNALKFSREEIRALYKAHFQGNIVKIRLEVDSQEQGSSVVERLSQSFEVGELNYHPRRDDSRLHLYTTLLPKNSISDDYKVNENTRLKSELAAQKEQIAELKKEVHRLTREQDQSYFNSPAYERNMEQLQELKEIRLQHDILKLKNEQLERELEQIKEKRSRAGRKRECSQETIQRVLQLREQGLSIRKIAEEVKIGSTLVHRIITDESYSKEV